MLEELSSALNQLSRLAELVAARLCRGDCAADWLPQLSDGAKRVHALYNTADPDTRELLRDHLAETAAVVNLAATCGDDWLATNRAALDADLCAARLRKVYGLDDELAFSP